MPEEIDPFEDFGRRFWVAVAARDLEALREAMHPDAVIVFGSGMPESGEVLGPEAFLELWSGWGRAFERFEIELAELIAGAEPNVGIAVIDFAARGGVSGADVTGRYFYVAHGRDGRLARGEMFTELEDARRAAGLTPVGS